MPNRIIKESTFESEKIAQLSDFEFRLWVGLITQADDAGRGDARPAIIKGHVFVLRERVTNKDIEHALHALAAAGCVSLYTVGGKPYYQFPGWAKHQRIRDSKPKYPGPEDGEIVHFAASCGELPQIAASCGLNPIQSNPIQSEYNPNPNPNPNPNQTRAGARETAAEEFERFWLVYPKKVGKKAAFKAFLLAVARKNGEPAPEVEELISAVERQKCTDQWQKEGGRYIPNPTTWLNQGRWADEPPAHTDGYQHHGEAMSPMMQEAVRRMMEEENNDER